MAKRISTQFDFSELGTSVTFEEDVASPRAAAAVAAVEEFVVVGETSGALL